MKGGGTSVGKSGKVAKGQKKKKKKKNKREKDVEVTGRRREKIA